MRTSRPFSTIWWGSEKFLKMALSQMEHDNKLMFWSFVYHHAEEDEKKDHYHVYMVPDGQVDTSYVTDCLTEYDVDNLKPIKPAAFQSSKFGDWFLYSSHNVTYLLSKGQTRKYHYSLDDFVSSNDDYLLELVHTIDMSKINRIDVVKRAAEEGVAFASLVRDGQIPVQQIGQYQTAYNLIQSTMFGVSQTIRGAYRNHEEVIAEAQKNGSTASETSPKRDLVIPKTYKTEEEFEADAVSLLDTAKDDDDLPF